MSKYIVFLATIHTYIVLSKKYFKTLLLYSFASGTIEPNLIFWNAFLLFFHYCKKNNTYSKD